MNKVTKIRLSNSSIQDYLDCGWKFWRGHVQGYKGEESDALSFGGLFHQAMNYWFLGIPEEQVISKFVEAANQSGLSTVMDDQKRSIAHGELLLREYFNQYDHNPLRDYVVLSSEQKGDVIIYQDANLIIEYSYVIDKLLRKRTDDSVVIMDHKTSYTLGDAFGRATKPSSQFTGYIYCARKHFRNESINECVVDGIQTARKKIETNPRECFTRISTYRTEQDLAEWLANTISIGKRIAREVELDSWTFNTRSCTMYGQCPFYDVCLAPAQDRERMLEVNYPVDEEHRLKVQTKTLDSTDQLLELHKDMDKLEARFRNTNGGAR